MIDLNQVNVIENLVPISYQNHLYDKYTKNFYWYLKNLNNSTSYNSNEESKYISPKNKIYNNIQEGYQFTYQHFVFDTPTLEPSSLSPFHLLHYIQMYTNYNYEISPLRIKTNFQPPLPNKIHNSHSKPHIDITASLQSPNTPSDLYTLLYYVNNSDGDTIIFNEGYHGYPVEKFTLQKKITPKKGLMVMFPTNTFHCGSHPINSKARIVINFNFQLIPL